MGGITMWIILGGLIGLVVIFLLVTSILDKKKRNRIIEEKKELNIKLENAGENVSKKVMVVVKKNEKDLKSFIPSVGNKKMSDINNKAKEKLLDIKRSEDFRLLKSDDKESDLFTKYLETLIHEKSNNWQKRNYKEINFFSSYKKPVIKSDSKKRKKVKK